MCFVLLHIYRVLDISFDDQLTFYNTIISCVYFLYILYSRYYMEFVSEIFVSLVGYIFLLRYIYFWYLHCMVPLAMPRCQNPLPFFALFLSLLCFFFKQIEQQLKIVRVLSMFTVATVWVSPFPLVYKKL